MSAAEGRRYDEEEERMPARKETNRVELVELLDQIGREREWVVEGAIEREPIIVLSGPEKRGKSWINVDLAVSIASGTPWLGAFPVRDPGDAVVVDGEYGAYEWMRRAKRVCAGKGLDPRVVLPRIRYFWGGGLILDKMNAALLEVFRCVKDDPPSIVIVDPLRNFLEGDENSAKDVLAAMYILGALRSVGTCPVLVTHHLNKSGGVSGSRAIKTRADLLIDGTDEERPKYSATGRTIRSGDAISKPFSVRIEHEDDGDDRIAKTRLLLRHEGDPVEKSAVSKSALRLLEELKKRTTPASANDLGKSCGVVQGSRRSSALRELEDAGLASKTVDGKWEVSTPEFFASMSTSKEVGHDQGG